MASRAQSVTITFFAWDTATGKGKTGDNANFTLRWIKDGTASAPTNASSEVDATNLPGLYKITMTATEATCDVGILHGKSSTAGIEIVPFPIVFEQLPTAAAGAAGGLPTVDASNRIAGIQGTINNLNNLDAAITTRLASASYTAPDNATITAIAGYVDTEVAAIKAKTDQLLFTGAGNVKADVEEVLASTATATSLARLLDQVLETGTFRSGSTTTSFNLAASGGGSITAHQAIILIKYASGLRAITGIASVSGAGGATPSMVPEYPASVTTAPTSSDTYVILAIPQGDDPIATAVPGSYAAGTVGYKLGTIDTTVGAISSSLSTVATNVTTLLGADVAYKRATAVTAFMFPIRLTDGTPATGKTVTVQVSKDGGSFANVAASSGIATEISGGWYKIDLSVSEMTADEVGLKMTATGCQQLDIKIRTQS